MSSSINITMRRPYRGLIMLFLIVSISISFTSYRVDSRILVQSNSLQEGQGYAITGSHSGGVLGFHFDCVGDVNGDGIDDFIIGEPWYTTGTRTGRAYLFLGRLDASWDELTLADAQASFIGEGSINYFGGWTGGLGDIDGNGYADFGVAAPGNDEAHLNAGKFHVFLGGSDVSWTMDTPARQSNVSITGEASHDCFGSGFGIGDTNGDGYDDFIVSSFQSGEGGSDAGQLYLFLGRPHGQWLDTYSAADANASWIGTTGDYLGISASGVGDVNNDGFADFAVGAWSNAESYRTVYLIFGSDEYDWSMDQPISMSNASLFGRNDTGLSDMYYSKGWFSGAGDVNGDGFDDVIIGAYEEDVEGDDSGCTYLFLGRPTEMWAHNMTFSNANASFVGESAIDWSGYSVSIAGDVNGDSFADFVIGAPTRFDLNSSASGGHTYLILGGPTEKWRMNTSKWRMNTSLAQANYTYETEMVTDGFGIHVHGVGDVNNDGLDDFAIGAPFFDTGQSNVGKTYIILYHDQTSTWTMTTPTTTTTPLPIDMTIIFMVAIPVAIFAVVGVVYLMKRRRS
ncbi:MAG: hypothetical protein ACXAAN_02720 [Candidatus Thorarchaeota archaeon]